MGYIDSIVCPVGAIPEDGVIDNDDAARRSDVPLKGTGPVHAKRPSGRIGCLDAVYVFSELVKRIAARRGLAHHHFQNAGADSRKCRADLRLVMSCVWKPQFVTNSVLRR